MGQVVTTLPDDEVKEILYHTMPDLWRKKKTEQGYNYLDRSIQTKSAFLTRVQNLETPAPPPAIRSLPRKKKKKNSKKQKAVSFEDSDKDSSDDEKPASKKKFCQYHGKCSHSTDKYTTLKGLIKKAKSNKSKGYRKVGEKTCTKHTVNALIKKKVKKAFKGRKKRKQELCTFEKWMFQDLKNPSNLLTTAMHLVKAMTAEA